MQRKCQHVVDDLLMFINKKFDFESMNFVT